MVENPNYTPIDWANFKMPKPAPPSRDSLKTALGNPNAAKEEATTTLRAVYEEAQVPPEDINRIIEGINNLPPERPERIAHSLDVVRKLRK